jgi:hypothetical protein
MSEASGSKEHAFALSRLVLDRLKPIEGTRLEYAINTVSEV